AGPRPRWPPAARERRGRFPSGVPGPVSLKGTLELRGLVSLSHRRSGRIVRSEEARLQDDTVGGQLVEEVRLEARARQGRQKTNCPGTRGLSLLVRRLG